MNTPPPTQSLTPFQKIGVISYNTGDIAEVRTYPPPYGVVVILHTRKSLHIRPHCEGFNAKAIEEMIKQGFDLPDLLVSEHPCEEIGLFIPPMQKKIQMQMRLEEIEERRLETSHSEVPELLKGRFNPLPTLTKKNSSGEQGGMGGLALSRRG